ncbi:MAG: hypothetical protein AAFX87_19630 [Bacteroidota bacterium]
MALIIVLCVSNLKAQLNNSFFEDRYLIEPADSNKLFLGLNVLGFNKNNEYFNDIADGFTLFGYQFSPYISYRPLKNVRIDAGAYFQKDFGNDGFTEIAPLFTLKVEFDHLSLVFGNLESSLNHRLIEPLYDFERVLNDRLENGLQVLINRDNLFLDAWIDWELMITKGDPNQEEVSGGLSLVYDLYKKNNLTIQLPFQFVAFHRGGQIDSNPGPLVTLTNFALGGTVKLKRPGNGFVKEVRFDNYYVYYRDFSSVLLQPFLDGNGLYFNVNILGKKGIEIMGSYWRGNEFISFQGGQLYPSVSSTFKNPDAIEPTRELFILRFMHNIKVADNLYVSSRIEPYYDFRNEVVEFSHGLYINYRTDFYLWKNPGKRR